MVVGVYMLFSALAISALIYLLWIFFSMVHSRLAPKPSPVQEMMQRRLDYLQADLEKREQQIQA